MFNNIETKKKAGNEKFVHMDNGHEFQLIDFWKWAYSDIIGNAERGILAEYIVSSAFNTDDKYRVEWDAYDILTEDGIKIEVKRQVDIYIFCVHKHKDENTINPLDMNPWDFYVLNTKVLNKTVHEELKKQLNIVKAKILCI